MLIQPAALPTTEAVRREQPCPMCRSSTRNKLPSELAPRSRRTAPVALACAYQSCGSRERR